VTDKNKKYLYFLIWCFWNYKFSG